MSERVPVVLLGAANVGKHRLIIRKTCGTYADEYEPGIQDSYHIQMTSNGIEYTCDVWFLNEDEHSAMIDNAVDREQLKVGEAFMICFSLTDAASFEKVEQIYNKISEVKGRKWPAVIVAGCKSDLTNDRKVTAEQIQRVCVTSLGLTYFETSAKTGAQTDELFQAALDEVIRNDLHVRTHDSKRSGSCSLQ